MTRRKKSRKPGLAPLSASRDDKKVADLPDKKPKKHKGKVSGNRQKEAIKTKKTQHKSTKVKDPRVGSKKPILLGNEQASQKSENKAPKKKLQEKPLAAIRVIDNHGALHDELEAIENDAKLQEILAKQEESNLDLNFTNNNQKVISLDPSYFNNNRRSWISCTTTRPAKTTW